MSKYTQITMKLHSLIDLIAFADSEEKCKELIEKGGWHLLFSPKHGEVMGIPAKIWIVYKEDEPANKEIPSRRADRMRRGYGQSWTEEGLRQFHETLASAPRGESLNMTEEDAAFVKAVMCDEVAKEDH